VAEGRQLVEQAGTSTAEMVASVRRVTGMMSEISAASVTQSAGIEQVNAAIAGMEAITRQNAALVEQAAAASGAMREQADGLAQAVGAFRLVTPPQSRRRALA
jgi:methyl-accepting chemotaxis protein